jgi:hypothetical protein
VLFLQLIVHLLLGYRELRESRYYQNDPLVKRLLGLKRLPDVATLSRMLKEADAKSVANLRQLLRDLLFERLVHLALPRITLDFDGSVPSTMRHAEGTAVGLNKKRKGALCRGHYHSARTGHGRSRKTCVTLSNRYEDVTSRRVSELFSTKVPLWPRHCASLLH